MKQPSFSDSVSAWFKRYVIAAQVVAFICTIIIGLTSNNLASSNWALYLLLFVSLIYIFIEVGRGIGTQFAIPEYIKKLEYQLEKATLEAEKNRLNKSFDRISNAIFNLNGRTCSTQYLEEAEICSQQVLDSVKELLHEIVKNPNIFFSNETAKYCIIIRIDCILNQDEPEFLIVHNELFSDLNFARKATQNSLENYIYHGSSNAIGINSTFKNIRENVNYCFINIFEVCSDVGSNGAIIIASDIDNFSSEYIIKELMIFSRIITNWLYNYNQCLYKMMEKKNNSDICINHINGFCTLVPPNPPAQ